MFNKQEAMLDPASAFARPQQVLEENAITLQEKREILHRWAYDVNELAVAEEENMPSIGSNYGEILQQIHAALIQLGDTGDEDIGGSTKHGAG